MNQCYYLYNLKESEYPVILSSHRELVEAATVFNGGYEFFKISRRSAEILRNKIPSRVSKE